MAARPGGLASDLTHRVSGGHDEMSGLSPVLWHSSEEAGGTTILAYHDRWGPRAESGGVYISFSRDEGETWTEPAFVAPGAYPALHEYLPGEMICGYYCSNSVLEAAFFEVPHVPNGTKEP